MPRVSEVYAGQWVTAGELHGKGHIPAQIAAAVIELVGQDQESKLVLDLESRTGQPWPRRLILNKGNSQTLAAAYGDNTDGWVHKQIEVWAQDGVYQGRPGIKVKAVAAPAISMPPPAKPAGSAGNGGIPAADPELNDSIPF
jgi:hypothetical protein